MRYRYILLLLMFSFLRCDAMTELADPRFAAFAEKTPRDPGSGAFIVDGDVPIADLSALRRYYDLLDAAALASPIGERSSSLIVLRNGVQDDSWSPAQKLNLTYCVSGAFRTFPSGAGTYSQVVNALANASASWESTALVSFRHIAAEDDACDPGNPRVLFDVRPQTTPAYTALAFSPSTPRAGRTLYITPAALPKLLTILRHELGHVLGFGHEYLRGSPAGGCAESTSWRPLTAYDRSSIMHNPTCLLNFDESDLSRMDRKGAASLYGCPHAVACATDDGCGTKVGACGDQIYCGCPNGFECNTGEMLCEPVPKPQAPPCPCGGPKGRCFPCPEVP